MVEQQWLRPAQPWAVQQVATEHREALYSFGEYAMFVLMWNAHDFAAGRVGHCAQCYLSYGQIAEAYKQPAVSRCLDCYGSTFEGGYRAKIIRPALITDTQAVTQQTPRGEVLTDNVTVETTSDFTLNTNDYLFRSDGQRYQIDTGMSDPQLHGGFGGGADTEAIAGSSTSAHLEDPSSVAYLIPPDTARLRLILRTNITGVHLSPALARYEDIRGAL